MKKYFFSVADNKLIDSDGVFSADERSRPQSTLGQKDTINIQFVKDKVTPLVDYAEFESGTVARFLVDVDYQNPGVFIPLGNTAWSLSSGAEYKKALSAKPDIVELNGISSSEGTVGALAAGEWGYIDLSTEFVVRLSDDTDPTTKDDDFVQVLYINTSATPLFIEASSDFFNLPDSWLDDDGVTLRNPDITAGEVSFFLNSNTVNFYNRLNSSRKAEGFAEVQFFAPSTSLFFMKAKFNYDCTNRLLSSGEDILELSGVDVYTKAESDTRHVRQSLSTAYSEQSTILGTERLFIRDGSSSKQTTFNILKTWLSGALTFLSKVFSDYNAKTVLADADTFALNDSEDSDNPKHVTLANLLTAVTVDADQVNFDDTACALISTNVQDAICEGLFAPVNVSASVSPAVAFKSYFVDASGGAINIALPDVSASTDGQQFRVYMSVDTNPAKAYTATATAAITGWTFTNFPTDYPFKLRVTGNFAITYGTDGTGSIASQGGLKEFNVEYDGSNYQMTFDNSVGGVPSIRYSKGNISGAVTIDFTNGDVQICTTTATVTGITISNLTSETGMILTIDNAGSYSVTYNSVEIISAIETGRYACSFYNDNGTVFFMGKGEMI